MDRQQHRLLVRAIQRDIEAQKSQGFVAITKGFLPNVFTIQGRQIVISSKEIEKEWPSLMKEVGLVDDGTGYDTWTLPGRSITDHYSGVPVKKTK